MMRVSGAELRPGDRIYHSRLAKGKDDVHEWRHTCTVVEKPESRPGSWSLSCECRNAAGEKIRISVGPTQLLDIEREDDE